MKSLKRFSAIFLALLLTLSVVAAPASAANGTLGGDYRAWKIFVGQQPALPAGLNEANMTQEQIDNYARIGNVEWGYNSSTDAEGNEVRTPTIDSANFLADLQKGDRFNDIFDDCKTALEVAKIISEANWAEDGSDARLFAALAYQHRLGDGIPVTPNVTTLDKGYYLVVDVSNIDGTTDDLLDDYFNSYDKVDVAPELVRNLALLQLTQKGAFEMKQKVKVPTFDKRIIDKNDSIPETATTYHDTYETNHKSADHDIGDHVKMYLTATLDDIKPFEDNGKNYKLVFHDTLPKGLTRDEKIDGDNNNPGYKVYVIPADEKITGNIPDDYLVTVPGENVKFENKDNKTPEGNKDGGESTYTIEDITKLTYNDDNHTPVDIKEGSRVVIEYTATLNNDANFGKEGNRSYAYLEYSNNPNSPDTDEPSQTVKDDNGLGRTVVDTVIVFTYQISIVKVDENKKPLAGAEFTLEKQQTQGVSQENRFQPTGTASSIGTVSNGTKDSTGTVFTWKGLDDGLYKLTETKAPAGYNQLDEPIYFWIDAGHIDVEPVSYLDSLVARTPVDGTSISSMPELWKATLEDGVLQVNVQYKDNTGEYDIGTYSNENTPVYGAIINNPGIVLPETGGTGTTIFYVLGSVMLVAGFVFLIARKRMGGAE